MQKRIHVYPSPLYPCLTPGHRGPDGVGPREPMDSEGVGSRDPTPIGSHRFPGPYPLCTPPGKLGVQGGRVPGTYGFRG